MTQAVFSQDIMALMQDIGAKAKQACLSIENAPTDLKNKALYNMATMLRTHKEDILNENKKDMDNAHKKGLSQSMSDRLLLDEKRIEAIARSLEDIAQLKDPVHKILDQWDRPNGLKISKISTPLGVIGIIYESRPNVTADAGALAMKSGNCVILRGGSESFHSSKAIHACLTKGLEECGLDENIIQLVNTTDRAAVGYMLSQMADVIDIIIPRGGKSLVGRVQSEARVPVLAHLEGICHSYIHEKADPKKANDIVINAKLRRTGVCGATETLLVDEGFSADALVKILENLDDKQCQIYGCDKICDLFSKAIPASSEDWKTEYLAPKISVKLVGNIGAAIDHIRQYGSGHTEAIITEGAAAAQQFFRQLNSAILIQNASTQFADGGEFGMGAEIGIATGKIHARGPVGLEQLTCFKYLVEGNGQIRP